MVKKIVITGANGFLGYHTIQRALERKWNVLGIVRRPAAKKAVEKMGVPCKILTDFCVDTLAPVFEGSFAAIHLIGTTKGTKKKFKAVNVDISENVLLAAQKSGLKRVVTPSGLGVQDYGEKEWASNNYFWSKKELENRFLAHTQDFTIFRPSYILGPGDEMVPYLVQEMLEGKVSVVGSGTVPMQPVFVQDATEAFLRAAEGTGPSRHIYELVGDQTVNQLRLIKIVDKELGKLLHKPVDYEIDHVLLTEAPDKMDMSPEDVAVTQCDRIGRNEPLKEHLNLKISSIEVAVRSAVLAALKSRDIPFDDEYGEQRQ